MIGILLGPQKESYPNVHLNALAISLLRNFAENFKHQFPEKQLYFVINTGRPAQYAWGVIEALSAIREMRLFGVAEGGGVILQQGMESGESVLTLLLIQTENVPNPEEWRGVLAEIEEFFQSQLVSGERLHFETKQSSLAVQIASRNLTPPNWLHRDREQQNIDDQYISLCLKKFFSKEIEKAKRLLKQAIKDQNTFDDSGRVIISLSDIITLGEDQASNTADDISSDIIDQAKSLLKRSATDKAGEILRLEQRIRVLEYMRENLKVSYNPTAGYADIGHQDINKYSGVRLALAAQGIRAGEFVMLHIGDSSSDIIPGEKTKPGEINEGADEVYLIAVGNSAKPFKEIVGRRAVKGRGILVPRPSILAVIDVIRGLGKALSF